MTIPFPKPWLCLLCALFPSGVAGLRGEQAPDGFRALRDLPYVENGHERQRLDLYVPNAPTATDAGRAGRPLVFWLHGGGWETGTKQDCPAIALAARGYVVASVGYRLSSQAVYPAQIEDCKAAVRWLRAHAGEYGIDPARLGVWGASAGGHLAALLGTTAGTRRFDVGANLDQSSAVQCVLDWFGPTDFLRWGDPPTEEILDSPHTAIARLLGGTVRAHEALARSASPLYFVDENSAPFLIVHGDRDAIVPVQQSEALHAALQKAGVASTLKVLPGAEHGGPAFSTPENLGLMTAFFDGHLHPDRPR